MTTHEHDSEIPCHRCGRPAPTIAQICAHCRASLVVDLFLARPLADRRACYVLARDLSKRWPELPFAQLKAGLESTAEPLVMAATHDRAREVATALSEHDLESRTAASRFEAAPTAPPAPTRPRIWPWAAAAVVVVAAFLFFQRPQGGDEGGPPSGPAAPTVEERLSLRQIAQRTLQSTVTLRCPSSVGAGFFVARGRVLTNDHVLCEEDEIEIVLADGRRLSGVPEHREPRLDVALVRVAGADAAPLGLGDATALALGDEVAVLGNPHGLEFSLTRGIVSHRARSIRGVGYLQIDANINPGNSGGPLLDGHGRVVGVVSMTVGEATGLGLALPINYLYEGEDALLPRPAVASDAGAWDGLLDRVAAEDRREIEELGEAMERPLVAGAFLAGRQAGLLVLLARFGEVEPFSEHFFFEVERDGERLCDLSGQVETWQELDERLEDLVDDGTIQWMRDNRLVREIYLGATAPAVDGCPDARRLLGAELILPEADPHMRSATISVLDTYPLPLGSVRVAR